MSANWDLLNSSEFQSLPEEERSKGFAEVAGQDSAFTGLPKEEQLKAYADVVKPAAMTPRPAGPITEPGAPGLEALSTVTTPLAVSLEPAPVVVPSHVPVQPVAAVPESPAVAAHVPVAPEEPLIVRTPRGIESRDVMGSRPPILGRSYGLEPTSDADLLLRDIKSGLASGTQALAAAPFQQAVSALEAWGRATRRPTEVPEALTEAAQNRNPPPAGLAGKVAAFPGEQAAGMLPLAEAAGVGVVGTPALGAFLVNRFLSDYGAGKPLGEVIAGVGKEAANLAAMSAGGELAGKFLAPAVGAGTERAVSRALGAGPAEGAMAPTVSRVVANTAERVTRAVGAAVPVYASAKLQGSSDADAMKAAVDLGVLDLGMGLAHPTARQGFEQAVREESARREAADATSPDRAQVQASLERPPIALLDRIRGRVAPPADVTDETGNPPKVVPPTPPPSEALRGAKEAFRLAQLRTEQGPWWLQGPVRNAWAKGEVPDDNPPVILPQGVTVDQARADLAAAGERAQNRHQATDLEGLPVREGWLPIPDKEPSDVSQPPEGWTGDIPSATLSSEGENASGGRVRRGWPATGLGEFREPGSGSGRSGEDGANGGAGAGNPPIGVRVSRALAASTGTAVPDSAFAEATADEAPAERRPELDLAVHVLRTVSGDDPYLIKPTTPEAEAEDVNGLTFEGRQVGKRRSRGQVVLNLNARAPFTFAVGHEIVHRINSEAPHLLGPVEDAVRQGVDLTRWQAENRPPLGASSPEHEFLADFLGEQIHRREFWQRLLDKAPEAFQELAWHVVDVIDRIKKVIPSNYQSESYVRDLDNLRDLTANMLAEYQRAKGPKARGASELSPAAIAARAADLQGESGGADQLRDYVRTHKVRLPRYNADEARRFGKRTGGVVEEWAETHPEYRASPKASGAMAPDEVEDLAKKRGWVGPDASTQGVMDLLKEPPKRYQKLAREQARRSRAEDQANDLQQLRAGLHGAFNGENVPEGEEPAGKPEQAVPWSRRDRETRYLPGMAPEGHVEQGTLFGGDEAQFEPIAPDTARNAPPAQPRGRQLGLFEEDEQQAARDRVEARRRAAEEATGQGSLLDRMRATAKTKAGPSPVRRAADVGDARGAELRDIFGAMPEDRRLGGVQDRLTGLANRNALDWHTEQNPDWHTVMFDAKGFKSVNDTYGHAAGDVVLRHLADVMREEAGHPGDVFLARFGGDENVARVRGGDAEAADLATRITARLEDSKVRWVDETGKQVEIPFKGVRYGTGQDVASAQSALKVEHDRTGSARDEYGGDGQLREGAQAQAGVDRLRGRQGGDEGPAPASEGPQLLARLREKIKPTESRPGGLEGVKVRRRGLIGPEYTGDLDQAIFMRPRVLDRSAERVEIGRVNPTYAYEGRVYADLSKDWEQGPHRLVRLTGYKEEGGRVYYRTGAGPEDWSEVPAGGVPSRFAAAEGEPLFSRRENRRRKWADNYHDRLLYNPEGAEDAAAANARDVERQRAEREAAPESGEESPAGAGGGGRGGNGRQRNRFQVPTSDVPEQSVTGGLRHVADRLKAAGTTIGRVIFQKVAQGEWPHEAPQRVLRRAPAGEEFFQRVERAHSEIIRLQSRTTDPLLQALRSMTGEERRRLLSPRGDEKPFAWMYEDGDKMPSPGLERFAEEWRRVAGEPEALIPQLAKEVGLEETRGGAEWVRRFDRLKRRFGQTRGVGEPVAEDLYNRLRPRTDENPTGATAAERLWAARHLANAIEGRVRPISPHTGALVKEMRDLADKGLRLDPSDVEVLLNTDLEAGTTKPFAGRTRYIPHVLTHEAREALEMQDPRDPIFSTLQREAGARGISPDMLASLTRDPLRIKRNGSLEHERLADMPRTIEVGGKVVKILDDSPAMLIRHLSGAARRIEIARQFGPGSVSSYLDEVSRRMRAKNADPNVIDGYITQVAKRTAGPLHLTPGQIEEAIIKPWQRLQTSARPGDLFEGSEGAKRAWNVLEAITAGMNLSGATTRHVFNGPFPLMVRMGLMPTLKAMAYAWGHAINGEDQTKLRSLAYLHQDFMHAFRTGDLMSATPAGEALEGLPRRASAGFLRSTGFQLSLRTLKFATAYATKSFEVRDALDRIRDGEVPDATAAQQRSAAERRRYLTGQIGFSPDDVSRMVKFGATDEDLGRWIGKNIDYVHAINESPMSRPSHMNHPVWRLIVAYSSAIRKIAATTEWALNEARNGNLAPLGRLAVGGVLTGEAVTATRNWLKDREREETSIWGRLFDDLLQSGSLGLWEHAAYAFEHFGEPGHSFFVDTMMPPQAEALGGLVDAITGAAKGQGHTPFLRALRRTAPGVSMVEGVVRRRDPDFIAERLGRMLYLTAGTDRKGVEHQALDPMPDRTPNTAQKLLDRWRQMGHTDEELLESIKAQRTQAREQ